MSADAFARLLALVEGSGLPHALHEHEPIRTMEQAREDTRFDVARIVKTIAFRLRDGGLVLAALRGIRRADYASLARELGVNRRDLSPLSPQEVLERLGVAPGGVSPLLPAALALPDVVTLIDAETLDIAPTAYCGTGRADRTLEMRPADLLALSGARAAVLSKPL